MATGNTPCGTAIPQDFIGRPVDRGHVRAFVQKAATLGYHKLGELVQAGAQHLMLNPVCDERTHLQQLAEEMIPRL